MSAEGEKKSPLSHVPGILAGSAALIAALTTVYVNVRNGNREEAPAVPVRVATATAKPPVEVAKSPVQVVLHLDRVRTQNDGSMGSTDWTFEVNAAGDPLFSVPFKSLTDREGDNLAVPADAEHAAGKFELPASAPVVVAIRGWKRGWLPGEDVPDVIGQGRLVQGVSTLSIEVKSDKPDGADFVLYFSVTPAEGGQR